MLRSTSWPLAHSSYPVAPEYARRRGLPRITWLLVASAFLCGAMLSAAVFAAVWRHQAQSKSSADAALVSERRHSQALAASLVAAQTAGRRARLDATAARTANKALSKRAAALTAALRAAAASADGASSAASGVAGDLSRLTRELRTLTTYVQTTPASQLDGAYIQTQTDFLTQAVNRLGGRTSTLETAASAYATAAKNAARLARH